MNLMNEVMSVLSVLDAVALAFFVLVLIGYRLVLGTTQTASPNSLVGAVQRQRVAWMLNMVRRGDHRTMDVILLSSLGQGNAFFASTTAIAIGGLAALLGSGERAQQILEKLPIVAPTTPVLWEIKLLLMMAIFVFGFFKFAWAFRLSHYANIMIGATPLLAKDGSNAEACEAHAERAARLIGLAGEHTNSGLRAFYHAFAALAWFFHPIAFIIATAWVLVTLVRRDYFSRSFGLIAGQ